MAALQKNDQPEADDGLRTVFEFSSGMCRQAVGGTVDRFVKEAKFSVFAATVGCESFTLDPLQTVGDRFATQNLVSRDGFGRPVPRQPAHSTHSGCIWCLLTGFFPISATGSTYTANRRRARVRRHRANSLQGGECGGIRREAKKVPVDARAPAASSR
ncbi:unnamed protein product [Ascophyllum nodosum]